MLKRGLVGFTEPDPSNQSARIVDHSCVFNCNYKFETFEKCHVIVFECEGRAHVMRPNGREEMVGT